MNEELKNKLKFNIAISQMKILNNSDLDYTYNDEKQISFQNN